MGRPAQDITESELAVLRIVWDRQAATIRQITDVLYPQGEAAQYATVQKLLDRMEAKGYVERDRTMFVHVFRSALDRDELIGRRLRSLAELLCDGSLTPLLTHLARAQDLTEEDRLALRAIVDVAAFESDGLEESNDSEPAANSLVVSPQAPRSRTPGTRRGSTTS
jgi:BlaI family penicillinase repressor